jgi:hypothetical protein
MQPYNGKMAFHTYLELLASLSNIDKHRHLNLIRPRVRQSQQISVAGQFVSGKWMMLERGAVIKSSDTGSLKSHGPVIVKRRYHAVVAFNEREHLGDATDVPLDILLGFILYHLEIFVVPELVRLIKTP